MYGISTSMFSGLPLEKALQRVAAAGFREVELSCCEGAPGDWYLRPDNTRRALQANRLHARAVHSPNAGWNNAAKDPSARAISIDAATACFKPAIDVGANTVVIHANAPNKETAYTEEDYGPCLRRSIESLAILAERAAKAGVRMAVENLVTRGQPRPSVAMEEVIEMISGLGDHVGVCLDAGHVNAEGNDPVAAARLAATKIFAVHLQDNDGKGEDQHLVPGSGTIDWNAFIATLDAIAPECVRTFEVGASENEYDKVLMTLAQLRETWESGSR